MKDLFKTWLVETPIAHRGLWDKKAPENSLLAFKNAILKGYPIELDVQMLSDGTPVVFHDDSLSRMTGNDGYIKFLKKEDLEILRLAGTDEKIPTLQDTLEFVAGRTPLVIEIKNDSKVGELEQRVIDMLKKYQGEVAIVSFNPYVLDYFKKHAPNIIRGQSAGSKSCYPNMGYFRIRALQRMIIARKHNLADFINYEAKMLPALYLRKFKNLPLIAWTVRNQEEYLKTVKHCDNVIFDSFEPKI